MFQVETNMDFRQNPSIDADTRHVQFRRTVLGSFRNFQNFSKASAYLLLCHWLTCSSERQIAGYAICRLYDVFFFCYRENGDMDYMNALVNELSDQVSALTPT